VLLAVALKAGEYDAPESGQFEMQPALRPDHGLFEFDIQAAVTAAVSEVCDLMLAMQIGPCEGDAAAGHGGSRLSGGICFREMF